MRTSKSSKPGIGTSATYTKEEGVTRRGARRGASGGEPLYSVTQDLTEFSSITCCDREP